MDPLLDRFHRLLRSMFQTSDGDFRFNEDIFENDDDADYREAWEELEDFLGSSSSGSNRSRNRSTSAEGAKSHHLPPEELREDYKRLGVSFDASFEEVKLAHRKLVKEHHPDRHGGDPQRLKRATETTQSLNYSFAKIKAWEAAKKRAHL